MDIPKATAIPLLNTISAESGGSYDYSKLKTPLIYGTFIIVMLILISVVIGLIYSNSINLPDGKMLSQKENDTAMMIVSFTIAILLIVFMTIPNYKEFLNENDTFRFSDELLKRKPKLIYRQTSSSLISTVDFNGNYCDKTVHIILNRENVNINPLYLMCLFNSKLLNYFYKLFTEETGRAFAQVKTINIKKIPFLQAANQQPFIEKADIMLSLNKELQELSQKFQRTLQRKFELQDLPKKLEEWYLLSYSDFIKELTKKKIKLSLSDEAEWEEYFNTESKKALELKSKIDATDKEIDQMVYKLYELTEEEIAIVEGGNNV